jgi:hypothetical protein
MLLRLLYNGLFVVNLPRLVTVATMFFDNLIKSNKETFLVHADSFVSDDLGRNGAQLMISVSCLLYPYPPRAY